MARLTAWHRPKRACAILLRATASQCSTRPFQFALQAPRTDLATDVLEALATCARTIGVAGPTLRVFCFRSTRQHDAAHAARLGKDVAAPSESRLNETMRTIDHRCSITTSARPLEAGPVPKLPDLRCAWLLLTLSTASA